VGLGNSWEAEENAFGGGRSEFVSENALQVELDIH
jgi:hypothetical protein